jgi:hypothetical protein
MIKKKKMQNKHNSKLLRENLEFGDLKRLVHNELHIDEYKSKMGDDSDICVISFKVSGKEPSADLVSFIEKGYDYVLDADVSSGEKEGGDYLVFVELDRTDNLPEQIIKIMEDVMNLTEQDLAEWRVRYYKSTTDHDLTDEALKNIIPLTPEAYDAKYGEDEEEVDIEEPEQDITQDLDAMKAVAGVPVTTKAPKNEYTESLRVAAGLK